MTVHVALATSTGAWEVDEDAPFRGDDLAAGALEAL